MRHDRAGEATYKSLGRGRKGNAALGSDGRESIWRPRSEGRRVTSGVTTTPHTAGHRSAFAEPS
jgi:hypothetical protein